MSRAAAGRIMAAVAALALVLSWGRVSSFLTVEGGFVPEGGPAAAGRGFTVVGARFLRVGPGGPELSMRVERVVKEAGRAMRLEGVTARRPAAAGAATVLRAATGVYDGDAGVLLLDGGVEMRTADGYLVCTRTARYESRGGRISGRAAVEMRGPSVRVRGGGFDFFPDRGRLVVSGRVRCLVGTDLITGAS